MYIYDIGYGTCEESSFYQWFHEEQYSEAELKEIVYECLCEAYEVIREPDGEHRFQRHPTFQDLMGPHYMGPGDGPPPYPFHEALEKRGFKRVEFESSFTVFGWAASDQEGDWGGYSDEHEFGLQRRIRDRFGAKQEPKD